MDKGSLKRVGAKIGHYTDRENLTGVTVFIAEKGMDIGIDIRGSNTGSYNTEAYSNPKAATRLAHGIVLTGGSSYGLESVFGLMQYLEEKGIANKTRVGVVPGITGGVIYDLTVGTKIRPAKEKGYKAAADASYNIPQEGNAGVGTGATTGKWFCGKHLKGGFGIAEVYLPQDILVCSFVVTNSYGDAVNPKTGKFYYDEGNFDLREHRLPDDLRKFTQSGYPIPLNTTLAVIATNMAMNRNQLLKVAEIAQDGMARSIFPVHSMHDGDIVFAISSHSGERKTIPRVKETIITDVVGLGAADALAKAVKSSILHAESIDDFPAYK